MSTPSCFVKKAAAGRGGSPRRSALSREGTRDQRPRSLVRSGPMCPQERAAETSADPLDAFLVSGATALVQGWEAEQRGETRHRGRIRSRSTARIGVGAVPGSAGRFNRTFQPSTARLDRPTGVSACEASAGCTLEPTVRAARQAREFVESALCRAHAGRALGAVKLAASEFATQGVLLGSGPARLHLACHVSHVEVTATYSVPSARRPRSDHCATSAGDVRRPLSPHHRQHQPPLRQRSRGRRLAVVVPDPDRVRADAWPRR